MKRTTVIMMFLASCVAVNAADATKLPVAKESDSRLHSDGKGWGLDKAKITDPTRPRVLLAQMIFALGSFVLITST